MKRALPALCLVAGSAWAAVTLTSTPGGYQPMRGTANLGAVQTTLAQCEAAIRADVQARKTTGSYRCVHTVAVRGTWTPDPVVPPVVTPTDPHQGGVQSGNMPRYNPASIPAPARGSATFDVRPTSDQPYRDGDGMGAFRTVCQPSHFNRDDSLIYPGQVGRAHLHMYFGNTGSNANSTPESIRTTGNSTCRGGIANRSTYWVPALIDATDGHVVAMDRADVYYKTGYGNFGRDASIKPIPQGLRMIAGDMMKTTQDNYKSGPAFFTCGGQKQGYIPANCTSGTLEVELHFPQCWNGQTLTAPDHKSHMAYANNGCPVSHPVALPEISYIMHFPIPAGRSTSNWRLSSDNYVGGRGGNSMHGDWINGWDATLPPIWTSLIINRGLSGGSHMIGDGRAMY